MLPNGHILDSPLYLSYTYGAMSSPFKTFWLGMALSIVTVIASLGLLAGIAHAADAFKPDMCPPADGYRWTSPVCIFLVADPDPGGSSGPPPPQLPSCVNDASYVRQSPNSVIVATSCDDEFPRTATRAELENIAAGTDCKMWAISGSNCAGEHYVTASSSILAGLAALAQQCKYAITALGGGNHSANSWHYQGQAVDIDVPSTGYTGGTCTDQQVKNAFCGRGLHVNNEVTHLHIGPDNFADICP